MALCRSKYNGSDKPLPPLPPLTPRTSHFDSSFSTSQSDLIRLARETRTPSLWNFFDLDADQTDQDACTSPSLYSQDIQENYTAEQKRPESVTPSAIIDEYIDCDETDYCKDELPALQISSAENWLSGEWKDASRRSLWLETKFNVARSWTSDVFVKDVSKSFQLPPVPETSPFSSRVSSFTPMIESSEAKSVAVRTPLPTSPIRSRSPLRREVTPKRFHTLSSFQHSLDAACAEPQFASDYESLNNPNHKSPEISEMSSPDGRDSMQSVGVAETIKPETPASEAIITQPKRQHLALMTAQKADQRSPKKRNLRLDLSKLLAKDAAKSPTEILYSAPLSGRRLSSLTRKRLSQAACSTSSRLSKTLSIARLMGPNFQVYLGVREPVASAAAKGLSQSADWITIFVRRKAARQESPVKDTTPVKISTPRSDSVRRAWWPFKSRQQEDDQRQLERRRSELRQSIKLVRNMDEMGPGFDSYDWAANSELNQFRRGSCQTDGGVTHSRL